MKPADPSSSKSAANATNASDSNADRGSRPTLEPVDVVPQDRRPVLPHGSAPSSRSRPPPRRVDATGDRVVSGAVASRIVRPLKKELANDLASGAARSTGKDASNVDVE